MLESASQSVHRLWLDGLGATVSIACAVQCAALPILVTVLPFSVLADVLPFIPPVLRPGNGFDRMALAVSVALAVVSFSSGFLRHRRVHVFAFLLVALFTIGAGWLWVPGRYQLFFVVAGALVLAAGHILNRRLSRRCRFCRLPKVVVSPEPLALKITAECAIKGDSR
jgi:hypothetical protein